MTEQPMRVVMAGDHAPRHVGNPEDDERGTAQTRPRREPGGKTHLASAARSLDRIRQEGLGLRSVSP